METLALAASMRQIIQERLFSQKIQMCGEELPSLTVSNLKLSKCQSYEFRSCLEDANCEVEYKS